MPQRNVIYTGHILTLVKLDGTWEVAEHAPAVAVLALRGRTVLGVEQYRPAIHRRTWEVPAGLVDDGETPEAAARRELAEETQLGGTLEFLTQVYTSPGFTNEKIHLFSARDLSPVEGHPEADEDLSIVWRDVDEVWEDVKAGRVASSGPSVLALSIAKQRLKDAV